MNHVEQAESDVGQRDPRSTLGLLVDGIGLMIYAGGLAGRYFMPLVRVLQEAGMGSQSAKACMRDMQDGQKCKG